MTTFKKYKSFIIIVVTFIFSALFVIILSSRNKSNVQNGNILDTQISSLQKQIESNPKIIKSYIDLSNVYLQKVRETGDVEYYSKIDELILKAEKIEPNNPDIFATRAHVALGRHAFQDAKKFAEEAIKINPVREIYYGLLGDAEIELGQYKETIDSYQKMVDIRPGFNSYSRISYVRELYGDVEGAKTALKQAVSSGSSFPENIAWAYVELGKLSLRSNLTEAESYFNQALHTLPNYTPAIEGLGKVAYAQGDTEKAIEYFTSAFKILPLAQYTLDLAEVYSTTGDTVKENQYITLTQIAFAKSKNSGVDTRLEESLFLANHDRELATSLEYAKASYQVRKSIYGADTLSWAYYKNGNYPEAEKYGKEALILGEHDALILFHQGMIMSKLGKKELARKYFKEAYNINPNFSILYRDELKKLSI